MVNVWGYLDEYENEKEEMTVVLQLIQVSE
mgnify:CR=1 FL=1